MQNLLNFIQNINSSDLIFSTFFIGVTSIMVISIYKDLYKDDGNSPDKNKKSHFDPVFINKEDKNVQTIQHKSDKGVQVNEDIASISDEDIKLVLFNKFSRFRSVDEMRAIYNSKHIDFYLDNYNSNPTDFVHMAYELEKMSALERIGQVFSVGKSLGYIIPDQFHNQGDQTPSNASNLSYPQSPSSSVIISRAPSNVSAETHESGLSNTTGNNPFSVYAADMAIEDALRNHPYYLPSDLGELRDPNNPYPESPATTTASENIPTVSENVVGSDLFDQFTP